MNTLVAEGIRITTDGSVQGRPGGRPLASSKGRTPFRFIEETTLRQWAQTRACRGRLPELLTRLIRAEKGHEAELRFPSGDASELHGWDGQCRVGAGTTYIPDGVSGWELSTQTSKIKGKVESDFRKRTEQPGNINPKESTFVFVTPCRWPGKDKWVTEKKAEGSWADVRAYDAVDLVHWIEMHPAVGHWLAVLTGSLTPGLQQIEAVWEEWSLSTKWPVSGDLVLAGRDEAAAQVWKWLSGDPGHIAVEAESTEEGIAFLFALIAQLPADDRMPYLARCLIAAEPEPARTLGQSLTPLIIVLVENSNPGLAQRLVEHGHHVYSVFGSRVGASEPVIRLPRALRVEVEAALTGMRLGDDEAREAARDIAGSLAVFRRLYPSAAARMEPEWAKPENASKMIPALLAGGWDESNPLDREQLQCLAGKDYDALVRELTPLLEETESPLRKLGNVWKVASLRDALFRLARYVTAQDLERFVEVAVTVFGSPDPRYDLPSDRRWLAPPPGQMPLIHSDYLRRGLGEMLMALAIFGKKAGLSDAGLRVTGIVRRLLDGADARRWWSVHPQLDLFAEAEPDAFLSAVEASLRLDDPPVLALFKDEFRPLPIDGHDAHFLLSGLECLSWSPGYFLRASLVLARLAALMRTDRPHSNGPLEVLRNIFLPWPSQTFATLNERLAALDRLRKEEPQIAWELMRALVSAKAETTFPSARPRWRDFSEGRCKEAITMPIWAAYIDKIAKRLLEDVQGDGGRWVSLFADHFAQLLPERCREAVSLLSASLDRFDDKTRDELWAVIRKLLNHHRRFAGEGWVLPEEDLAPLEAIYNRLTPKDDVKRMAWLFASEPLLIHPPAHDSQADEEAVEAARRDAVKGILSSGGVNALIGFARTVDVENPVAIGTAAASEIAEGQLLLLLAHCLKAGDRLAAVGRGIVSGCIKKLGIEWAYGLLDRALAEGWTKEMVLIVLLAMPHDKTLWDRIAAFGKALEDEYWKRVPEFSLRKAAGHELFVTGKLLEVGRGMAASLVAASARQRVPTDTLIRVLDKSLIEMNGPNPEAGPEIWHYNCLERLLQELDQRPDADQSEIARLEWSYCPFLRNIPRSVGALHRRMNADPGFFAEIIGLLYRPARESRVQETEEEPTERRRAKADCAYRLLTSWKGVPGAENGSIDCGKLMQWIEQARRLCKETGRTAVGDFHIGQMLAYIPPETDGVWPAIAVRDAIERLRSDEIEAGVIDGLIKKHGSTWRLPNDGGDQERELLARYRSSAEATRFGWPRTSGLLYQVADLYESAGQREDQDVQRRDWR